MGNTCKNDSVSPIIIDSESKRISMRSMTTLSTMTKVLPSGSSSRSAFTKINQPYWKLLSSTRGKRTIEEVSESTRLDDYHGVKTSEIPLADDAGGGVTNQRTSQKASRKGVKSFLESPSYDPQSALVLTLSNKVGRVIRGVRNSMVLTQEDKQFVLEDIERACLLPVVTNESPDFHQSRDDAEGCDEMTQLFQDLLNSYCGTSSIQSSKFKRINGLHSLLSDLQDPQNYHDITRKQQLLQEMKKQFHLLLSCYPDEEGDDDYNLDEKEERNERAHIIDTL